MSCIVRSKRPSYSASKKSEEASHTAISKDLTLRPAATCPSAGERPYQSTQSNLLASTSETHRAAIVRCQPEGIPNILPTFREDLESRGEFPSPVMPVERDDERHACNMHSRDPFDTLPVAQSYTSSPKSQQRPRLSTSSFSRPRVPKAVRQRVASPTRKASSSARDSLDFSDEEAARPSFSTESTLCSPVTPDAVFEEAVISLESAIEAEDLGLTVSKLKDLQTFAAISPVKREARVLVATSDISKITHSIQQHSREVWKAMTTEEVHSIRVSRWNALCVLREQYKERRASGPNLDESEINRKLSASKSAYDEATAEYNARIAAERKPTASPDLSVVNEHVSGKKITAPMKPLTMPKAAVPMFEPVQWSRFPDNAASVSSIQPTLLGEGVAQIATVGKAARVDSLWRRDSCDDYLPGTQAPRNSVASARSDGSCLGSHESHPLREWNSAAVF